ncbi:hypothetical protein COO60DRAFT_1472707 [Scenedesmus sp. NREL 46B-D3]|nr:hypothetical protein COO60DRAFT_1472707 [Scenedesmus sp. NREL 46B-D3]
MAPRWALQRWTAIALLALESLQRSSNNSRACVPAHCAAAAYRQPAALMHYWTCRAASQQNTTTEATLPLQLRLPASRLVPSRAGLQQRQQQQQVAPPATQSACV